MGFNSGFKGLSKRAEYILTLCIPSGATQFVQPDETQFHIQNTISHTKHAQWYNVVLSPTCYDGRLPSSGSDSNIQNLI